MNTWQRVTTELNGREISGTYRISRGGITVSTDRESRSTHPPVYGWFTEGVNNACLSRIAALVAS